MPEDGETKAHAIYVQIDLRTFACASCVTAVVAEALIAPGAKMSRQL